MNSIGENDKLIDLLERDYNLLSAKLSKINIQNNEEGELFIDLHLELFYAKSDKLIMLRFSKIEEYSFYYNQSHYFYNVESYKLLSVNNSFYISLDPFMEGAHNLISVKDQDFIQCGRIEGFI